MDAREESAIYHLEFVHPTRLCHRRSSTLLGQEMITNTVPYVAFVAISHGDAYFEELMAHSGIFQKSDDEARDRRLMRVISHAPCWKIPSGAGPTLPARDLPISI